MPVKASRSDHEVIQINENEINTVVSNSNNQSKLRKHKKVFSDRFFAWLAGLMISEDKDKQNYLHNYNCVPPPLFILSISLAEIVVFIYYAYKAEQQQWLTLNHGLTKSELIYDPYKREEAWRFISYMFLHAGIEHILGNLLLQLMVGVLLEMVHYAPRVCIVYMSGVLAGSLASSIFDPYLFLLGASGGVYALLGGFFSHLVMNWQKIALNGLHMGLVLFVVTADIGFSLYRRIVVYPHGPPQVSLVAHFAGGLAGITVGYVVFSNYKKSLMKDPKWWTCLLSYFMCCAIAVFWNLFLTPVGTIV